MKTLTKCALTASMLVSTCAAQPDWGSGYRPSGTHVQPYFQTLADAVPHENLTPRGYPSQHPGYIAPLAHSFDPDSTRPETMPYHGDIKADTGWLPYTGNCSPKPHHDNSRLSGSGS